MLATHPIDEMILATDLGKAREPRTIEPEDTMPAEHHDLQDSASEPSDRTTIVVDASRGPVRGIATAVADAGAPVMAGSLGCASAGGRSATYTTEPNSASSRSR
jgi:hypothetical protein